MTIGINGNEANVEHRVGSGQYAFELISHLAKNKKPSDKIKVYLSSTPRADLPSSSNSWTYEIFGPKRLWTLTSLQKKLLTSPPPDVFFTPTHYTPLYMPIPSVISIMDLSVERFPEYFTKKDYYQLKYWTQASVMIAKKIVTISQHSKKELCSLYSVNPEKVVVTYPGYDTTRFNNKVSFRSRRLSALIKKYHLEEGYFVYLGTLQPRKNVERFVEAFAMLERKNLKLVIVGMIKEGRGGWMYQSIFSKVKALGLVDKVVFTGYLPNEDIPYIFKGSLAYVLPSLYEGFGIPPIEAMATGVPVVVSKVSSLPEICGDAAIYIQNPYEISSIRQALQEALLHTPSQRAKKISLGLDWVKRYNWSTTAKQTLEVLYDAAKR